MAEINCRVQKRKELQTHGHYLYNNSLFKIKKNLEKNKSQKHSLSEHVFYNILIIHSQFNYPIDRLTHAESDNKLTAA